MNIYEVLGIVAGILSLLGYGFYLLSILRGNTLPNRATWITWTVVGLILAISYDVEGDKASIWLPIGFFLGPFFVTILSFFRGMSVWTLLDKSCLFLAFITLIPWIYLHDALYTLLLNVLLDFIGAIPTVVKSYTHPQSEDINAWIIFLIGSIINVLAISHWSAAALYPLYLVFITSTIVLLLIVRRRSKRG